mmetsp:Transcript_17496/g.54079  ORF Transcript_17496/g.54079 Transcript_17496/m.54079 type:complete len:247 (+) Transcript_17496:776-1516(+)
MPTHVQLSNSRRGPWSNVGTCAPLEFNSACCARTTPGCFSPCPCLSPVADHRPCPLRPCRPFSSRCACCHPLPRRSRSPLSHRSQHHLHQPSGHRTHGPGCRTRSHWQLQWTQLVLTALRSSELGPCPRSASRASRPSSDRAATSSCRRRRRRRRGRSSPCRPGGPVRRGGPGRRAALGRPGGLGPGRISRAPRSPQTSCRSSSWGSCSSPRRRAPCLHETASSPHGPRCRPSARTGLPASGRWAR